MKIKTFSWILACVYLFCGVISFFCAIKTESWISDCGGGEKLPFLTKIVVSGGPFGLLFLLAGLGAIVILKDLRFQSRALAPVFTIVLVMLIACIAIGLLLPFLALYNYVA